MLISYSCNISYGRYTFRSRTSLVFEGEAVAIFLKALKTCWICGTNVSLEECKVDEHGLAVHENCYLVVLAIVNAQQPSPRKRFHP
jgi:hypothetical protein